MNEPASMFAPTAFPDRFLEQARRRPTAPALIWHGEEISYGDLDRMVRDSQSYLKQFGPPTDCPVGILAKKSPQAISLILAAVIDRWSVLLPSVDLGRDTLLTLFEQAACGKVLSAGVDLTASPIDLSSEFVGPAAVEDRGRPHASAGDAFLILTTSGSTGVPKIVPLSLLAIDRFMSWAGARFGIDEDTAVLSFAPLNFDLCLLDIWTTLGRGGCVVLVDQERATNAQYLVDLLTANEVHVIQAVPMLYRLLVGVCREGGYRFESVRQVIATGESISLPTLQALLALFPRASFYNVYGSTETNDSFIHEIDMSRVGERHQIPIGEPIDGVSALVVSDGDQVVDGQGTGELLVATPFQTQGYLTEGLNDTKFLSYSSGTDQRTYFRTGDIVQRHGDGSITLEGRTDSYVKVRGVRISTEAVEQAILEHDEVVEVAVVAIPDDLAGKVLHAVVKRDGASRLNTLALRQNCARILDRAAIPSKMNITTTALPKTPNGKIDRVRSLAIQEEQKSD